MPRGFALDLSRGSKCLLRTLASWPSRRLAWTEGRATSSTMPTGAMGQAAHDDTKQADGCYDADNRQGDEAFMNMVIDAKEVNDFIDGMTDPHAVSPQSFLNASSTLPQRFILHSVCCHMLVIPCLSTPCLSHHACHTSMHALA